MICMQEFQWIDLDFC